MANICEYHILVRGRRNACHALFGGQSVLDEKWITNESGSDEDCSLVFQGTCKWYVDAYTSPYLGSPELTIPADPQDAELFGEGFWGVSLQEKSRLFDVEVWCNSIDIDSPVAIFSNHYICGESNDVSYEDMPQEIVLPHYLEAAGKSFSEGGEQWYDAESMEDKTFVVTGKLQYYENRDELVEYIEGYGGKVTGSVSSKTNFLISNNIASTSSKMKKAKELGIEVISEKEFIRRFGDPDEFDFDEEEGEYDE